jgi:hypothetical protein
VLDLTIPGGMAAENHQRAAKLNPRVIAIACPVIPTIPECPATDNMDFRDTG